MYIIDKEKEEIFFFNNEDAILYKSKIKKRFNDVYYR